MLLLRHCLHHTRKQHLADAQGQEVEDRPDLVQAAVDPRVMVVEVVLGEDHVLVVEDEHADDARGRGQREARHHAQAHALPEAAEMVAQREEPKAEDKPEAHEHGRHRARHRVARAQEEEDDRGADHQLERKIERERGEALQPLQDAARDRHLPDERDRESEDQDRDRRADVRVERDRMREQRGQQDEEEARDRDQANRAGEQRADTRITAHRQHRGVAREDDDEDQRRPGADRVDRDEKGHLAVGLRAEDATRDGVVDEAPDARDETAEEEDEVLPDKPVLQQLGQPLARSQSLHVRGL